MNQEEWYKEQGVTWEFQHTCTACGKKEVAALYCHDDTRGKHVNLCYDCNDQYLGYKKLTNLKLKKLFIHKGR